MNRGRREEPKKEGRCHSMSRTQAHSMYLMKLISIREEENDEMIRQ